jgi:60 kDa SS-A/Ro ribonucleoprotein
MLWALKNNIKADAFVIYTDNETWAGAIHPHQALEMYRQKTGIPAKLIPVGMTATQYTVGNPDDVGTMNVVGFDTATPQVISDFIRG